jgi:hypothetical protein
VLSRLAPIPAAADAILSSQDLTDALLVAVADEDVSTARHATDALCSVNLVVSSSTDDHVDERALAVMGKAASAVISSESVKSMRYLELVMRLATTSDAFFTAAVDTQALDAIAVLVKKKGKHPPPNLMGR